MSTQFIKKQARIYWLDLMKVVGIYFIILGHLFSFGSGYALSFSVALFFIVSGFISHEQSSNSAFWRKMLSNYIFPMLALASINFVISTAQQLASGLFTLDRLWKFPINVVLGFHMGLGTLWFVYTLIILKIILQYTKHFTSLRLMLFFALPLTSLLLHDSYIPFCGYNLTELPNGLFNTCLAYPFFILGYALGKNKQLFPHTHPHYTIKLLILCFISASLSLICYYANGSTSLYLNNYGKNIFLCMICGITGTAMVYAASAAMPQIMRQTVTRLSTGMIIILAFHYHFTTLAHKYIIHSPSLIDLVIALVILALFVPIVNAVSKWLPWLMGKRQII